jgi:D-3-phosphoglycerate dehydrogenase
VGEETAAAVRDFLNDGIIRNAVNFPSVSMEQFKRLRPYLQLARHLGSVVGQMGPTRIHGVGVRYYGELASEQTQLLGSAVLEGVLAAIMSSGGVTPVNARAVAAERGIELIESRSSRPRNYTSLISVKLHMDSAAVPSTGTASTRAQSSVERWVEGTAFENGSLRLVLVDGVAVEAPLEGTLLIISNTDQPGVIGAVGTLLGHRGVNIASFALGRNFECAGCAIGVVNLDEGPGTDHEGLLTDDVLGEIRAIPAIQSAWRIRL